jgi:hypothetical protein
MKTRDGFVSNSSSSSFVIGWKCGSGDLYCDKLTAELKAAFIPDGGNAFSNKLFGSLLGLIVHKVSNKGVSTSFSDYLEAIGFDSRWDDVSRYKHIEKMFADGFYFSCIRVCSEGDAIEQLLLELAPVDLKTDNLYLQIDSY